MSQQIQATGWKRDIQNWLESVSQNQKAFGGTLSAAARRNQFAFPKHWLVAIVAQIVPVLARAILRSALKDAAGALGLSLSDSEMDVLTDFAMLALTS
jgi:hypothetical protein